MSRTAAVLPLVRLPAPPSRAAWETALADQREQVWRGDRLADPAAFAPSTGFPALDAELPGGGWPASGLTELLLPEPGCGEIRLLAPALRDGSDLAARQQVWIAPPYMPYAPALHGLGWPLGRLTWLAPSHSTDAAWAAEQALRSGCCGAVLWWGDAPASVLRRLHLAAQQGASALFLLRPLAARGLSSPAPLRVVCTPTAGADGVAVEVFKRRGPPMARPLRLRLPPVAALRRTAGVGKGVGPRPAVEREGASGDVVARAAPAVAAA